MMDKIPRKRSACNASISGTHPGPGNEVVQKNVCVKENNKDCNRQYEIRIRNCLGYYTYNLPWSRAATNVGYCFKPGKLISKCFVEPTKDSNMQSRNDLLQYFLWISYR